MGRAQVTLVPNRSLAAPQPALDSAFALRMASVRRASKARTPHSLLARCARFALLLVGLPIACGGAPLHEPDRPVDKREPRATVTVRMDLPPASHCEETLDLALYRNRAIELLTWAPADHRCTERIVQVRYLARHLDRAELLREMARHTLKLEVLP